MYDTDRLRGDAESKSTAQMTNELTYRHEHNAPGSWETLAAEAAMRHLAPQIAREAVKRNVISARQAEAFVRQAGGEKPFEIAENMQTSTRAVRRLLKRARRNLARAG